MWVQSLGWEDPLERKWQTTSVVLPGRIQFKGSQRVRYTNNLRIKRQPSLKTGQRIWMDISPEKIYKWTIRKCLRSLIFWKMQIKTIVRYHFTIPGMVIIFFLKEIAVLLGMWRSQNPHNCWGECKILKLLWKIVVGFQKAVHRVTIWLSNFNPVYLTWENWKTSVQTRICIGVCIAVLFIIAKMWEQPKFPATDRWIDKVWGINTVKYSTVKTDEVLKQL